MKLEEIGFYTLSDYRAKHTTKNSPLSRCELILTDKCNFKCIYCRGLKQNISGTMEFSKAKEILALWFLDGLKNIRFSGGEPTIYGRLEDLVFICKDNGVERIAVSTNGSADFDKYENLIAAGINDFSISLDSCCSSVADKIARSKRGTWSKVVENIKNISKLCYTTVGVVINEINVNETVETVLFADSLGVSDIRIIPSAQYNRLLYVVNNIPLHILRKYPILRYRVNNIRMGHNVRGLRNSDCNQCSLVLDDMAIAGNYHFPCIIYMREHGNPIGKINSNMREERYEWMLKHNIKKDKICLTNCLDVCIDYNNKVDLFHSKNKERCKNGTND